VCSDADAVGAAWASIKQGNAKTTVRNLRLAELLFEQPIRDAAVGLTQADGQLVVSGLNQAGTGQYGLAGQAKGKQK
jgi:hypothetical protein